MRDCTAPNVSAFIHLELTRNQPFSGCGGENAVTAQGSGFHLSSPWEHMLNVNQGDVMAERTKHGEQALTRAGDGGGGCDSVATRQYRKLE